MWRLVSSFVCLRLRFFRSFVEAEIFTFILTLLLAAAMRSFNKYRLAKSQCEPCVPYLGVYLQGTIARRRVSCSSFVVLFTFSFNAIDLTFIEEGNNDKLENGYINFVKFRMIAGSFFFFFFFFFFGFATKVLFFTQILSTKSDTFKVFYFHKFVPSSVVLHVLSQHRLPSFFCRK
jgi:hypothetical protein